MKNDLPPCIIPSSFRFFALHLPLIATSDNPSLSENRRSTKTSSSRRTSNLAGNGIENNPLCGMGATEDPLC